MRILWHGISPYRRTGYGVQCRLFAPLIRDLGHTLAIAEMGEPHPVDKGAEFDGIPVIRAAGRAEYELPRPAVIRAALGGNPDLIIVLKDAWVLPPAQYRPWNTAVWVNIDCEPMGAPDRAFFEQSGAVPVAVARHGLSMLRGAGLKNARYVPHGVDTEFWRPGDQGEARELLGLPAGAFIAGLNGMNLGTVPRKAFYEQFAAFAQFRNRLRPDALLLAHTNAEHPEGINLRRITEHLGITDAVKFAAHANMTELQLRSWYRSLDVLMNATYGEGFGIPVVEALACGVPVIGTDCTALTEKIPTGAGWLVSGQKFWNDVHGACWTVPHIGELTAKLDRAAQRKNAPRQAACRNAALPYDCAQVAREHWKPLIEELTA